MLPKEQRPTTNKRQLITNKIQGFTLIELLVVMAVMSILVGVGINTFTIAQKKARDTKRKADLRTLRTAIEAYYVTNGFYPMGDWQTGVSNWPGGPAGCVGCRASWSKDTAATNSAHWISSLPTEYLSTQPKDPNNDSTQAGHVWNNNKFDYTYTSLPGGNAPQTSYRIVTRLEDFNDPDSCYSYYQKTSTSCPLPHGLVYDGTAPTNAATGLGALYVVYPQ